MFRSFLTSSKRLDKFVRRFSYRAEAAQSDCLMNIGTRSIFSEEHDMLRTNTRKFMSEYVIPNHKKWEEQGQVDRDLWLQAGHQALLGIAIPEEDGGVGGDILDSAVVWEELAYANCSGPGFALHSDIVMPYISRYGTKEQKGRYLPKMTSGKCIGAIAMTEPVAGSDLQGIRTTAKRDGNDWVLNGSKVFITNGCLCDVVIVVAITNPQAKSPAHGISLFLVDAGTTGFTKGRKLDKMGLKAQDTALLVFEDVRLPQSQLLGEENGGFYMLMKELPQERLLIADISQAGAEFVFETTRSYMKSRKAFGHTLSHLQTIQHRLAEMKTSICVSRAFVDQCLNLLNQGNLDSGMASMAKYWASDLYNRIAYDGVQLHGGWGYMWEYAVCKAYVDARVQSIYGGSNEIMKELIGRSIVKE
ncbi:Long-chain specific acyl-CoA dehydrogenase [Fasciola hepatica]|uniref:Long-chain specific acyl-CoA dehydrogenase, mitochondrial n=1 Tax=Fasciola hepatica TaxID=6192 RepID=A0A4E0REP4_FASHE|nr:Long-chain specific acyl-CoA dehydrogenase [Fasciola hepatica]